MSEEPKLGKIYNPDAILATGKPLQPAGPVIEAMAALTFGNIQSARTRVIYAARLQKRVLFTACDVEMQQAATQELVDAVNALDELEGVTT